MELEERDWYSHGLKYEEAQKLERRYAKIGMAKFGLDDQDKLALSLGLDYETGSSTAFFIYDQEDIRNLLIETENSDVSKLEGLIVEAFVDVKAMNGHGVFRGLSINKFFLPGVSEEGKEDLD